MPDEPKNDKPAESQDALTQEELDKVAGGALNSYVDAPDTTDPPDTRPLSTVINPITTTK